MSNRVGSVLGYVTANWRAHVSATCATTVTPGREREGGPKFVNLLAPLNGARCFCPGHLIAKVDQFHRAKRPRFNLAEQLETRCSAWSAINRSRAAESAPLIYLCALIECWPAVILLVGH